MHVRASRDESSTREEVAMADAAREPLTLFESLREEYGELRPDWFTESGKTDHGNPQVSRGSEDPSGDERSLADLFHRAHHPPDRKPLSALCLSGGGIRSA